MTHFIEFEAALDSFDYKWLELATLSNLVDARALRDSY